MLTRCPACETIFRVTPEQIKARAGRVRCGECQHAFNALDTLIEEALPVAAPPPLPPLNLEPTATEPELHEPEAAEETSAIVEHEPIIVERPLVIEEEAPLSAEAAVPPGPTFEVQQDIAPVEVKPEPVETEVPEPVISEPSGIVEAPEPLSESLFDEPEPPLVWPWVVGSVFALIAIVLQATIAFRVELATLAPEAKPALVSACQMLGCTVDRPAKVELLSIESSDLHPDPEQAGRLGLAATLKNRAPFAQMYPHLELTLTDTADKAIVRKVLAPADYLPPKTNLKNGMPANADLAVAIGINPGDVPASGYRLYLFYP